MRRDRDERSVTLRDGLPKLDWGLIGELVRFGAKSRMEWDAVAANNELRSTVQRNGFDVLEVGGE